jgi:predicted kinase
LKIVLTVGLPGSGKSTYLANLGVNAISSDEVRRLLADDPAIQTIHRRVFAVVRYLIRQRLELGRPETYVDATNLTPQERRPYIRLAQLYGADIEALFFDTPLEVCLERNRNRDRVVPEAALRDLARRLRPPKPSEGFTQIKSGTDGGFPV